MGFPNTVLLKHLDGLAWFDRLGQGTGGADGVVYLSSLAAWGDDDSAVSPAESALADSMAWLPATHDGEDPFYPGGLRGRPGDAAIKAEVMQVNRLTLQSLRFAPDAPALHVGPHPFLHAAKGSAVYAFRAAAMEIGLGAGEAWQRVVSFFVAGHLPRGLCPDGRLIFL